MKWSNRRACLLLAAGPLLEADGSKNTDFKNGTCRKRTFPFISYTASAFPLSRRSRRKPSHYPMTLVLTPTYGHPLRAFAESVW